MAYNGKTVSLGSIVWKVLKNPLASEMSYEDAAEFTLEYIRLVGAPMIYTDVISKPIKLNSYKACLPDDTVNVKGIKYIREEDHTNMINEGIALMRSTDVYHSGSMSTSDAPEEPSIQNYQGFTYVIEKGIIKTSIQDGYIVVSYKGLATDNEGFPLIPDQEQFKLGLEYYILHRYLEPLWLIGKITDKAFQYIEQKRHFYLGSASNALQLPDADQMESMMNGINRLINNPNAHANFFRLYGEKEQIKRYE